MRALAVLASLAGCWTGGAPAAAPAPAPAPARLEGTVLVWADAHLYLEPRTDAPFVQLAALRGERSAALGYTAPMTVVADRGELVEVAPADHGCGWMSFDAPADLADVRVLVRRADVAPVLARPFERAFGGKTRVALSPGVAVARTVGGYAIELAGARIVLPIPDASIASAYRVVIEPIAVVEMAQSVEIENAEVSLGEQRFRVRGTVVAPRLDEVVPGRARLLLREPCRTAIVAVDAKDVRVSGGSSWDSIGTGRLGTTAPVDHLPAGTVLRSHDRAVAHTTHAFTIPAHREGPPCLDLEWSLGGEASEHPRIVETSEPHRTMHVCADPAAVVPGPP